MMLAIFEPSLNRSYANAVAQGSIVKAMAASNGKSLKSARRRNQTPSRISTKNGIIHHVDDFNKCAKSNLCKYV